MIVMSILLICIDKLRDWLQSLVIYTEPTRVLLPLRRCPPAYKEFQSIMSKPLATAHVIGMCLLCEDKK